MRLISTKGGLDVKTFDSQQKLEKALLKERHKGKTSKLRDSAWHKLKTNDLPKRKLLNFLEGFNFRDLTEQANEVFNPQK